MRVSWCRRQDGSDMYLKWPYHNERQHLIETGEIVSVRFLDSVICTSGAMSKYSTRKKSKIIYSNQGKHPNYKQSIETKFYTHDWIGRSRVPRSFGSVFIGQCCCVQTFIHIRNTVLLLFGKPSSRVQSRWRFYSFRRKTDFLSGSSNKSCLKARLSQFLWDSCRTTKE